MTTSVITYTGHLSCLKWKDYGRTELLMELTEAHHWNAFITLKKLVGNKRALWLLRKLSQAF